jgi:hypothetical protein
MKKQILFTFVFLLAASVLAEDFVAPRQRKRRAPDSENPTVSNPVQGAIPQAIRTGRPLNLVNPFAPKIYGTGAAFVYHVPHDPFVPPPPQGKRATGFKLFSFEF